MQSFDSLNKRNGLVERIITTFGRTGMATAPFEGDTYLSTTTVTAINLHVGGFANHDEIGTNALMLDQSMTRNAIAPFFHVAKIIERPVFRQPKLFQCSQRIDHGWRGTLLIASTQAIDDAIFELTRKRIPLPLCSISNTDRINVAIVEQYTRAIANTSQDVAHRIPP